MNEIPKPTKTKRPARVVAVALVAALLLAGVLYLLLGQQGPTSVNPGDLVILEVNTAGVADLYGYQFDLAFDDTQLAYEGLSSSVGGIDMIFQKQFEGYMRVGATKIGEQPGAGGKNLAVCEVVFSAREGGEIPLVTLSGVNVVTSELEYLEGMENWEVRVRVEAAPQQSA